MRKGFLGVIAATLMLCSLGAQALPQAYNISWEGNGGYSLTGMFSFDTNARRITHAHLTSFMIEGFYGTSSLGIFDGQPELFFYQAGSSTMSSFLQAWNVSGSGPNFGCIFTICGLAVDQSLITESITPGSLINVIPKAIEGDGLPGGQGGGGPGSASLNAPTGILALFAGLAALAFRRRALS